MPVAVALAAVVVVVVLAVPSCGRRPELDGGSGVPNQRFPMAVASREATALAGMPGPKTCERPIRPTIARSPLPFV